MWTNENRARYDRSHLRYPSDLSDDEWKLVEPLIPPGKRGGDKRTVIMREVVNGLMYILSTGCRWEDLPHDIKASGKTCNRRLLEYQKKQVWQRMQKDLMKEAYRKGKINLKNGCAMSGGKGQVKTYPVKTIRGKVYVAFEEGIYQNPTNQECSITEPENLRDIN